MENRQQGHLLPMPVSYMSIAKVQKLKTKAASRVKSEKKRCNFCSAIDKEYAVGTFTGRVVLYFGVAEPLLEFLQ